MEVSIKTNHHGPYIYQIHLPARTSYHISVTTTTTTVFKHPYLNQNLPTPHTLCYRNSHQLFFFLFIYLFIYLHFNFDFVFAFRRTWRKILSHAHLEPCQTSRMTIFCKKISQLKPTIFAKTLHHICMMYICMIFAGF